MGLHPKYPLRVHAACGVTLFVPNSLRRRCVVKERAFFLFGWVSLPSLWHSPQTWRFGINGVVDPRRLCIVQDARAAVPYFARIVQLAHSKRSSSVGPAR